MLFFRSEADVRILCLERGIAMGPLVTMEQLWKMATTWYSSRLERESRRPQADEIRGIFADIGLTENFWDPKADVFG